MYLLNLDINIAIDLQKCWQLNLLIPPTQECSEWMKVWSDYKSSLNTHKFNVEPQEESYIKFILTQTEEVVPRLLQPDAI